MSIKYIAINSGLSWAVGTGITAVQRGTAACVPTVIKSLGEGAIACLHTVGVEANYSSPLATITVLSTAGINCLYGAWENIFDNGSWMRAGWYILFGSGLSNLAYSQLIEYNQPCKSHAEINICRDQLVQSVVFAIASSLCLKACLQRFSSKPIESVLLLATSSFLAYSVVLHGHVVNN